ncbi:MAG: hypothetical protein KA802_10560 [Saprospiraceae bacterium]|nr:hypothetical protein [Saprospiraceae bacterium]
MVYNDTSTNQGIVQDIYFGISANSSSYPIADVTRAVNMGLDKVSSIILQADNRWQFDDKNNTTLPIATTDLVLNQQDYEFDSTFLEVEKVMVSDPSGYYHEIYNIDIHDQGVTSYLENQASNTGQPFRYDVIGNSILLDTRPNYNYTDGLKVYFKRKADYFTTGDTTKIPGFASQFHKYLSLYGQYEYAVAKSLKKAETLKRDILEMEKKIAEFYAKRSNDYKPRFISKIKNPR